MSTGIHSGFHARRGDVDRASARFGTEQRGPGRGPSAQRFFLAVFSTSARVEVLVDEGSRAAGVQGAGEHVHVVREAVGRPGVFRGVTFRPFSVLAPLPLIEWTVEEQERYFEGLLAWVVLDGRVSG
jgi:hypothetical protein